MAQGTLRTDPADAKPEGCPATGEAERRAAIERVESWRAWLRVGADADTVPVIPSDDDFELARGEL